MKKILSLVTVAIISSCSIEQADKDIPIVYEPIDGNDGVSVYFDIEGNCATPVYYIGVKSNEIDRDESICFSDGENGEDGEDGSSGQDGTSSETRLESENGCLTIDVYNNGILADSKTICPLEGEKGDAGNDGDDGKNGYNGTSSRIKFEDLLEGDENCEHGGTKVISYVLETGEITDVTYLCNVKCVVKVECITTFEEVITKYTFEEFVSGDIVSQYDVMTVYGERKGFYENQAMVFDSNNPTGGDDDLGVSSGNILIISEDNDSTDPDDNGGGGSLTLVFEDEVEVVSLDLIDLEGSNGTIKFYDSSNNEIKFIKLNSTGHGDIDTQYFSVGGVFKIVVSFCESAALDNLVILKEVETVICK